MAKPTPHTRTDYRYFQTIATRWHDNDIYGHINNAVYYFYFDTVVNGYLVNKGLLQPGKSPIIGLVVETGCAYFTPMAFPDIIDSGLRITHLGHSSVRYELALFSANNDQAAAQGHFVHVYVDAKNRRPLPLPDAMRLTLEALTV